MQQTCQISTLRICAPALCQRKCGTRNIHGMRKTLFGQPRLQQRSHRAYLFVLTFLAQSDSPHCLFRIIPVKMFFSYILYYIFRQKARAICILFQILPDFR